MDKWNYYFEEGDFVIFHEDCEDFFSLSEMKWINPKKYAIGTVTKCWSEIHAYGRGSTYMCQVNFNKEIISCTCGLFKKLTKETVYEK